MTIKYKNTEYPLQWGLGAIEIYCDSMNCGLDGLDTAFIPNKDTPKAITHLIFAAAKNYAETENTPFSLTYRQVQSVLSDMPQDEFELIKMDFLKSKYMGESWIERLQLQVDSDEKKSQGETHLPSTT